MNTMAIELNNILANTQVDKLLSSFGKRIYFPKGILSQSSEANEKAHRFNATIGMAYVHNEPFMLSAVKQNLPLLNNTEAVGYASTSGVLELRNQWKKQLAIKNKHLNLNAISLPLAVPGLTAGISYTADMFLNEGDAVVIPDLNWPNYKLILEERIGAVIHTYKTFTETGFNIAAFEKTLLEASKVTKKVAFILNFPNNPTGYSPTYDEANLIVEAVKRVANQGITILAISDDAYFGLQYEQNSINESLFSFFSTLSDNILAVKVDGATKEDCVWGFRSAFITFGGKGLTEAHYKALENKLMGIVRSAISNSPAPTQYIMVHAMKEATYASEKEMFYTMMKDRYTEVRRVLTLLGDNNRLKILPFNSGYFMCFECIGINAETLRLHLLSQKGIGTISLQEKYLRVAFSSIDKKDIEALYREIYSASQEI